MIWVGLRWIYFSIAAVAEAHERSLMQRRFHETQEKIQNVLRDSAAEVNLPTAAEIDDRSKTIYNKYEKIRDQVRQVTAEKTAQFWIMFMNLTRMQQSA